MRRLSGPESSDSAREPSPLGRLSPVSPADPDQAAGRFPDSATPSVFYRSFFARECEAVVFQLSNAGEGVRPRCPLTIQEETLTPLELPCSFLDSFDVRSPPRPVPEPAPASAGPPDSFAAVPRSTQCTGLAEISLGAVARLAAASPVSGLAGVSSELEKASPPSGANVTYECNGSGSSANATYICTGSPSLEEKGTPAEAASAQPALEVCKRELPFVTSTPLMAPSLSKDAPPSTLRGASGSVSKLKPSANMQWESGCRGTLASNHKNLPAAASSGADRVPHVSGKALFAKGSLSVGAPRSLRTRGPPGIGNLPKGTGTARKIPQPAGGKCSQNSVPPARSGSALQSQPVTQVGSSQEALWYQFESVHEHTQAFKKSKRVVVSASF